MRSGVSARKCLRAVAGKLRRDARDDRAVEILAQAFAHLVVGLG